MLAERHLHPADESALRAWLAEAPPGQAIILSRATAAGLLAHSSPSGARRPPRAAPAVLVAGAGGRAARAGRRGMSQRALPPPDWDCLHLHALEPANMPRVLAGLGFTRMHGPMPRGGVLQLDSTPPAIVHPQRIAEWPCRLLVRDSAPRLAVYVCEVSGEWADHRGGARGESLIALGAYVLGVSFGKAGWRIARLCGLEGVPPLRPDPPGARTLARPAA